MPEKLVDTFTDARKRQLREELQECTSLQEIGRTIREEVAFYTDLEGSYLNSLTGPQARTAIALLAIVKESTGAISKSAQLSPRPAQPAAAAPRKSTSIRDTAIIAVCAGLGVLALAWLGFIGSILGAIVAAAAASWIVQRMQPAAAPLKTPPPAELAGLTLNPDQLISSLTGLFERIDEIVLAPAREAAAPVEKKLEDFPDVLQFLQKISGRGFGDLPDRLDFLLQEEMPSILAANGVVLHEPEEAVLTPEGLQDPQTAHLYTLESSKSVAQPTLYEKAILVDGRVLMKGKIRVPRA